MTTERMKAVHAFLPISRVNDEQRTVEAYGFVNETVKGEGGIRLKRTSMEAATPDYMKWANIREMHRADSAVGTTSSVKWDEKGAHMTLRVTDDAAWEKVKSGVYKGLSVGVIPEVMRGKDVEKCCWMETSLVDRPADPDAKITVFRADGFDPEAEHDVQQLGAVAEPSALTPALDIATAYAEEIGLIRSSAFPAQKREKLARKAIRRFAAAAAPLLDTGKPSNDPASKEPQNMSEKKTPPPPAANAAETGEGVILARLDAMETRHQEAVTRLEKQIKVKDASSKKIARKADKKAAKADKAIERLGKSAVPVSQPVRFPAALERNLDGGSPYGSQSGAPDPSALLNEYKDLMKAGESIDPADPRASDKRNEVVDKMAAMKPLLASVGVEV